MKFSAVLCLLIIFACGCSSHNMQTRLLSEQKSLKDSANNMRERINDYYSKGLDAKAAEEGARLDAVHTRLINIQSSIDSLANLR